MKSIKQNCVRAGGTIPFVKQSNWECTNKGISISYNLLFLGNKDIIVPFTEFGNGFFLEPVGSMYN